MIDQLRRALTAALPGHPATFGVELGLPAGPGWHHPLTPSVVAQWCPTSDAASGLGVAEQLGTAVLGRVVAAVAAAGATFDVGDLALHRHERGYLDAAALVRPAVRSGTVAELSSAVAAGAVPLLTPVLAAVADATRPAPLWDAVADGARAAATVLALNGHPAAHTVTDALVAALAAHGAPVRPGPPRAEIDGLAVAVRVTCCLLWTGVPAAARAAAYCSSCPHLDPQARAAARYRAG